MQCATHEYPLYPPSLCTHFTAPFSTKQLKANDSKNRKIFSENTENCQFKSFHSRQLDCNLLLNLVKYERIFNK